MSVPEAIRSKLRHLPAQPGVYLLKDAEGEILYVGKAKSLRSRVRTYFSGSHARVAEDARVGAARPRRRHDRRRLRGRGAHPREQPDQGAPPALQRQPQGRQELSVHQGHRPRALSARLRHAAPYSATGHATSGRTRTCAACAQSLELVKKPLHRALLPLRSARRAAGASVPGLPHRPLQGAVRGSAERGRVRGMVDEIVEVLSGHTRRWRTG